MPFALFTFHNVHKGFEVYIYFHLERLYIAFVQKTENAPFCGPASEIFVYAFLGHELEGYDESSVLDPNL